MHVHYFRPSPPGGVHSFVVFINHGASEHGNRYAEMAEVFTAMGGLVVVQDHRGHGLSVEPGQKLGEFPGSEDPLGDIVSDGVRLIESTLRGVGAGTILPWILVGHSMGSVISQYVLSRVDAKYKEYFRGLLLSGPPAVPSKAELIAFKGLLKMMMAMKRGQRMIHALTFDKYDVQIRKITGNKNLPKNSWLTEDPDEVEIFTKDPLCGQDLDFNLWLSLLRHLENLEISTFSDLGPVPVLIVGGEFDAATNFGKNLDLVRDRLKRQMKIICLEQLLIPGSRHELNKGKNRHILYAKLHDWTSFCLGKPKAAL